MRDGVIVGPDPPAEIPVFVIGIIPVGVAVGGGGGYIWRRGGVGEG